VTQGHLFAVDGFWQRVRRTDPRARRLADRHYSRQTPGAAEFMASGRVCSCSTARPVARSRSAPPSRTSTRRVTAAGAAASSVTRPSCSPARSSKRRPSGPMPSGCGTTADCRRSHSRPKSTPSGCDASGIRAAASARRVGPCEASRAASSCSRPPSCEVPREDRRRPLHRSARALPGAAGRRVLGRAARRAALRGALTRWSRTRRAGRGRVCGSSASHQPRDCALIAVQQVRRWGGVLEHPAGILALARVPSAIARWLPRRAWLVRRGRPVRLGTPSPEGDLALCRWSRTELGHAGSAVFKPTHCAKSARA
jgi:hypothetical protein